MKKQEVNDLILSNQNILCCSETILLDSNDLENNIYKLKNPK